MKIKKIDGTEVSEAATLQEYFGRKQEQTLQQFMAELKALKPEDKTELAHLSALALGYTVED